MHSSCSYSGRMHWLHILYINTKHEVTKDCSNALVFRENDKIILEITEPIKYGTSILATFYNISLEDILSITDYKNHLNETSEFSL